jgi:hypothetical protein
MMLLHLLVRIRAVRRDDRLALAAVLPSIITTACVVHLRYQVDQDAPDLADRLTVVDVVIRRGITLSLPLLNGDAAAFIIIPKSA